MNHDVISGENELSIASNKIMTYANFLAECVESYVSIVGKVGTTGIQDENVSEKLAEIAKLIQPYKTWIVSSASEVQSNTAKRIEEIAEADNFVFPEELTNVLKILFSQFL